MKNLLLVLLLPLSLFAQENKAWKDIAYDYYSEENYSAAIEYYEMWLKADPLDASNWYNLACCYALNNDVDNSLTSLQTAIQNGWNSCEHMIQDEDLKLIQGSSKFQEIVMTCEKNRSEENIRNYTINHLLMESIGTYGILLPSNFRSEKTYSLLVWLHGNGSNEESHAQAVEQFGLENVIIVFPRAPYINKAVTEHLGILGWTATQTDGIDKSDDLYLSQGSLYVDWIDRCVEDVKSKYKIDEKKCVVFGHSQGAGYSLAYAMAFPEKVKSVISFAGGKTSKFPINQARLEALQSNEIYVDLLHGKNDQVVSSRYMIGLLNELKAADINAEITTIEAGHSFGSSSVAKDAILELLQNHLNK